MKYLKSFLLFWRGFIVGDDSTIAVVVMWALLSSWSLATNFYNVWVLVPVVVIILLVAIIYLNATKQKTRRRVTNRLKFCVSLLLPSVLVTVVPLCLFRISNGQTDPDSVLIPAGLLIASMLLVGRILWFVYVRYPILAIFIAGVVAYIINLVYQPSYIHVAVGWYAAEPFSSVIFSVATIVVFAFVTRRCLKV